MTLDVKSHLKQHQYRDTHDRHHNGDSEGRRAANGFAGALNVQHRFLEIGHRKVVPLQSVDASRNQTLERSFPLLSVLLDTSVKAVQGRIMLRHARF
jgi:hypothetical protein